jgi:hypothetical protein
MYFFGVAAVAREERGRVGSVAAADLAGFLEVAEFLDLTGSGDAEGERVGVVVDFLARVRFLDAVVVEVAADFLVDFLGVGPSSVL